MATTTTPAKKAEEFVPIPLEELDHYWLDNGAPVIVGNVDNVARHVEAAGYQIYYVLSYESITINVPTSPGSSTTKQEKTLRPQFFKVTNNFIGRAVVPTDDLIFDVMERSAWFALPKIPYALIDMMDAFFRAVDNKLHTESILILTYDSEKTGPDGWGVVVPDQENTGGKCEYKPESVAEVLAQTPSVYQVGSAHSHPGMSAYASGIDHDDQADFDGLHITFGWQKHVQNGATQYHIELQMQGDAFRYDPSQIFEDRPPLEVDQELLDSWMEKVSKKTHVPAPTSYSTPGGFSHYGTKPGGSNTPGSKERLKVKNLPKTAPDIEKTIFVAVLTSQFEKACPYCDTPLVKIDLEKRRCLACHQYIMFPGETIQDVLKIRRDAKVYSADLDPDMKPVKPVYVWDRKNTEVEFELVYTPPGAEGKD